MKKEITAEYIINREDISIHCTLYRKACKNIRIAVTPDQKVKITAPLRAPDSYINEVLSGKTPWIIKTIRKIKGCQVLPLPVKYSEGEKIAYLGEEFTLKVVKGKNKQVIADRNLLVVEVKAIDPVHVKRAIDSWCRVQAERLFSRLLEKGFSRISQHGFNYPLLRIRSMKSRWGSCSRSGIITLNLKLIHLPEAFTEYIIMHELCHLAYLNHSRDFYLFLQSCMPDWKERKNILENIRLGD
ncbi:MAG: M48 family metallopeptidase [Deltaproteobacteria bacterium]|nr:M48 family metallopeptidase [Deltaproteobacteria bacterium]